MEDDSNGKIRPSDFIEDDGTLQGVIRQIEEIIKVFSELNAAVKKEDFTKWLNNVAKGSNEEKVAIQALTTLAERLLALEQKLVEVRAEESKELARLNQMVKDENRDKAKEAEINSKVAGSYARMKLELQQLVEQYKNTTDASQKSKLADGIILLSNELMLADKELKNLMNDYTKLSATEQARLATLERERAASEAAAESIKKRAKAEAELNEVTKNRGAVESTALAEQMRKAIEERIQLEAKELMLQDQFYAKELSSAEMIKQRLAIKEQLTQTEAKLKALEMQEANDLAIVKARVTMKQQQLDVEAKIIAAESQEGRNLAENEAKLKRIHQQNERNAQIATAVAGSYEHMKLTLQAKLDVLNNVNRSQGVAFSNALAEVAAAQQQVTEAEAWLNIVKQQANEQVKLNLLSDQEYQSMVQKNKELALEIKYTQGVVDSRAKLAAIQQAATTYNANGQSQLEEIKYNEELAASIKRVEDARAKAALAGTQEYRDRVKEQIKLENDFKQAKLAAVSCYKQEEFAAEGFISKLNTEKMTYNQLDALYKQVEMSMKNVADTGSKEYEQYIRILDEVTKKLNQMERQIGITSNRMSSRQRQWNGLTNSVYQLSREIPNLAVRADTFFLAISNNIPIFIDEFKRAKDELGSFKKALGETGKAFARSIPLSLILLALSNWSKLAAMADKAFGTLEDGTYKVNVAYRKLHDTILKTNGDMGKHIATLAGLASQWKKLTSDDEKMVFLDKYKTEIEQTGFAVTSLTEAETLFSNLTGLVVESFMARAKAAAAMKLATDEYNEALQHRINLDKQLSKVAGKNVSKSDLSKTFFEYFGGAGAGLKMSMSGKVTVPKSVYKQLADQYFYALSGFEYGGSNPMNLSAYGMATDESQSRLHKYMEQKLRENLDEYEVPEDLMYAYALELLGGSNQLKAGSMGKYGRVMKAGEKERASEVRGAQFAEMAFDEMSNEKAINDKLGLMKSDTEKYTQQALQLVSNATKTMNEAVLNSMGESFDKQRLAAENNYVETLDKLVQMRNKIEQMLKIEGLSEETKANLEDALGNVLQTWNYAYDAYQQKLSDIAKDETVAVLQAAKANIDNRLAATKEGSDEEIALRRKSIQKAMQIEIAENAKLEAKLQRSVSAIRAKYRREEEKAEREWLIKKNNWLKQQLENENASEISLTLDYYSRRRAIQQIELENELLENAELIENGQIKREDIIRKHLKAQENLWKEHRNAVLSSQKSMWDVVEELAHIDSYTQLAAQLNKYDIELEQTKLQQQEIIDLQIPQELERINEERSELLRQLDNQEDLSEDEIKLINKQIEGLDNEALMYRTLSKQVEDYIKLLETLTKKRKQEAINQRLLNIKQREQQIQSLGFYSQQQVGERQGQSFELQQEIDMLELQIELEQKIVEIEWALVQATGEGTEEWERANTQLELYRAQLNQAKYEQEKVNGWQGTLHAISQHGLMAGIMQLPQKDANGNTMRDDNGAIKWKDLSADQYDAVNTALDTTKTYVNELMQSYVDLAQAAYDAAQAQVDAAKTAYEAELEARANGYANDVEGAKQELALERRKAKQKEQILKSAQKAQEHINTLQQISSLITGSAQILETFAAYPVIAGVLLAAMWGSFAAAKIKANQVANQSSSYGEGGFEVAVGGSHASGHDIKTGIKTTKGSQMVIEGGEGVGVFSRKAVTKYGDIIPNLVDSINDGSYSDVGNSQGSLDRLSPAATYSHMDFESAEPLVRTEYAKEIMAMQPITNETDLSAIEGKLDTLIKLQDNKQLVLSDGSIMERKGNKVTITRRG